jgi:type IV secretion system protein VirB10
MRRRVITTLAAAAMLIAVLAPLSESVALAAQKKRACSCKPALKRKTRIKHTALNSTSAGVDNGANASLVGPVYATYTLPRNQYFRLRMNQTLNSRVARVGDRFQTTVVTPVYASGVEVVPAGSVVEGRVASVNPARTRGREGQIGLQFDTVVLPDGTRVGLDGSLTELQDARAGTVDAENEVSGNSSEKRNIGYIGGGTVGGAVLGGAIGGGKGAGIGAIIGAGAGVAGVMLQKGNEVELRSGTEIGMTTTQPITFNIRSVR